jgi:hypothetical protein
MMATITVKISGIVEHNALGLCVNRHEYLSTTLEKRRVGRMVSYEDPQGRPIERSLLHKRSGDVLPSARRSKDLRIEDGDVLRLRSTIVEKSKTGCGLRAWRVFFLFFFLISVLLGVGAAVTLVLMQSSPAIPESKPGFALRIPSGDYPVTSKVSVGQGKHVFCHSGLVPVVTLMGEPTSLLCKVATSGIVLEEQLASGQVIRRALSEELGGRAKMISRSNTSAELVINDGAGSLESTRFVLHVSDKGSQCVALDAESMAKAIDHPMRQVRASKSILTLDAVGARLRDIFGGNSGTTVAFLRMQRDLEPRLAKHERPEAFNEESRAAFAAFCQQLQESDPLESLYTLTVLHGDVLSRQQIDAAKRLFGLRIAPDYPENALRVSGSVESPFGSEPVALALVSHAPDGNQSAKRDSFLAVAALLRGILTEQRGPEVEYLFEEHDAQGNRKLWYRFTYSYRQAENCHDEIIRGFRVLPKDRPAFVRLMSAIKDAGKASGPVSLLGEHVYNLDYVIDMRECIYPKGKTADGFPRDRTWFWRRMLADHPDRFSAANRAAIRADRSPRVDEVWCRYFPHRNYMQDGERLVHHHIGRGPLATPIPERAHRRHSKNLHPDDQDEEAANPITGLPRTGSALKTDPDHAFPDLVDDFAVDAQKFRIPTKGPGGVVVRESDLYQLEGSWRGKPGVFEWIVDQGQVTHRRYILGGKVTGLPNQRPGAKR